MDLKRSLGFHWDESAPEIEAERQRLLRYVNLQLLANGLPAALDADDAEFAEVARGLLENHRQQARLLRDHRCPADRRIEAFLERYCADLNLSERLRLPARTLVLDRHGMARELSLPAGGDEYSTDLVQSYRVRNGVLHNPRHDRRTTQGTFHVVEGGLPIPADKKAVPKAAFAELFRRAVNAPPSSLLLPFTSRQEAKASSFVSLLIRPLVCPEVPGFSREKRMEIRFIAPGSLASNLDFVESIFGNAGDPYLPDNDAGLDVEGWSGHSGAVILAPHLDQVTKKELGLPPIAEADERRRRDGMCWESEDEIYNDGKPFKLVCRDASGVIVTLISDNYFGYCKKEVKSQISFAANLFGGCEEEHAGGTIAFPSFSLGDEYEVDSRGAAGRTFSDVVVDYADSIEVRQEGYGIDKNFPDLVYIPESARAVIREQCISWPAGEVRRSIPLLPGKVYMTPSGYKLRMEKHPEAPSWRLIGTEGEGAFCHKPCTVSGGGKSEISKSLRDYMHYGPIFVSDIEKDLDLVEEIFARDYSTRWKSEAVRTAAYKTRPTRRVLDPNRTLGSTIKLLTPSPEYTDDFNAWLAQLPNHIHAVALIIKRFYRPSWGEDWRSQFGVDIINGEPGYELKFRDRKLVGSYLRVGLLGRQTWRTFKLRQDFAAAGKIQTEDDISASVVVPGRCLGAGAPGPEELSYKFAVNCEYRLFQRPDDAIHRGLDKQTEADLSRPGNFISNFEPLSGAKVAEMTRYVVDFDAFSGPMQQMLREVVESGASYVVCSANPRQIDGKPTKNPRYLQDRPDLARPLERYVAERGLRLARGAAAHKPVYTPVDAVLLGRRNNPPDRENKIRGLAVYGPIHYQETPELFMDFIASLTGKSPSTTGFGSEGALTKGPFNSLLPAADLNMAVVSYIVTGLAGYSTAAGNIGPNVRVGHDISLLIPEVWCRLSAAERDPRFLIAEGLLEKIQNLADGDSLVRASRLGYRINYHFVRRFFGRVFDNPDKVFDEALLRPESQDFEAFIDGVRYITESHQRVARQYFEDGTVEQLCPPLKALVHIMAEGSYEGMTEESPEFRALFVRENVLASDWYRERLRVKQTRDIALWERHQAYLRDYAGDGAEAANGLDLEKRRRTVEQELARVRPPDYLDFLQGTLGADPAA